MSNEILCETKNKVVDYDYCMNKCQYFFRSACISKINMGYQQGRADAIEDVIKWFQEEFEKQNNSNSKFVPSCVIKENIYDVLEQLKELEECE